jgi:hypothetical protein
MFDGKHKHKAIYLCFGFIFEDKNSMKRCFGFILIIFILASFAFIAKDKVVRFQGEQGPRIKFDHTFINADSIKQGRPITFSYPFINSGDSPLVIITVRSNSGNYSPNYTRGLILPGDSGVIQGRYAAGYPGLFRRSLKVFCNDTINSPIHLYVKGVVKKKSS